MSTTPSKLRDVTTTASKQSSPSKVPVVRAIDVGFGLVKLSVRSGDGVEFISFPSMAIPADASAVRTLGTRKRDTFDVPVNDAKYEVGRDVGLAQAGGSFGRDVTDEFYRGAIYEALTKGALRYMAGPAIPASTCWCSVCRSINTTTASGATTSGPTTKATSRSATTRPSECAM